MTSTTSNSRSEGNCCGEHEPNLKSCPHTHDHSRPETMCICNCIPCHQSSQSKGETINTRNILEIERTLVGFPVVEDKGERWEVEFDVLFYEGERNSVYCKAHKTWATPVELKRFIYKLLSEREAVAMEARILEEYEAGRKQGFAAGAEMERATWINQPYNAHDERIREAERARILEALPLFKRWDDKTTEGYKKNSAVEDTETGRNSVLREIRSLLSPKTTE